MPEELNEFYELVIVGSEIDPSTERKTYIAREKWDLFGSGGFGGAGGES
jgi:hypothetical protein